MGRSLKKPPYVDEKLLGKVRKQKESGAREPIRTWCRRCMIPPDFVNHTFLVHNGRMFLKVFVIEDMVGHKLGEFAPTRLFRAHGGAKKKEEAAAGAGAAATPAAGGGAAKKEEKKE